jgi:hypothetical protein
MGGAKHFWRFRTQADDGKTGSFQRTIVNLWHFTQRGGSQICFSKRNGNQTRQFARINVKTRDLDSQFSAVAACRKVGGLKSEGRASFLFIAP